MFAPPDQLGLDADVAHDVAHDSARLDPNPYATDEALPRLVGFPNRDRSRRLVHLELDLEPDETLVALAGLMRAMRTAA